MRGRNGIGFVAAMVTIGGGCLQIVGWEEPRLDEGTAGGGGVGGLCLDGVKNGDETSQDCGGGCVPCTDGDGCVVGPDCESRVCIGGTCIAPGCTDQVANGEEIDVDCGGSCPKCDPDQACTGDQDCKSNTCVNDFCLSTCSDTAKGGDETGVDCGGSECPACQNGEGCDVGPDCESGVCKVEVCVNHHVWSKRFGGSFDIPRIAVDGAGNAALVSAVQGTVDFGGGPLDGAPCDPNRPFCDDYDVSIARFDAAGNHLWSKRFGDTDAQIPNGVAVTDSGIIATTGFFGGTVSFGSSLVSAGGWDIFFATRNASGAPLSSNRFGDASGQSGDGVALDSLENICLIGGYGGTVDFGGSPLTSMGGDIFIAKLDSLGNHLWSKRFGDAQSQFGDQDWSITVDGADNILAAGSFNGGVNFGGDLLTNVGGFNMFVVKLDSAGNHLWSKRFGDDQPQAGVRGNVVVDDAWNIVVSGSFEGTVDFGGGPLTSAGDSDLYVAKLDALGNHIWSKRFGNAELQSTCSVAVDGVGNVLLAGDFYGTIDFGGGPLISAGDSDIFVAKFDPLGNHISSARFGDYEHQGGYSSVAAYDSEHVLITGTFGGSVDFGGGPLVGGSLFLAKLRL